MKEKLRERWKKKLKLWGKLIFNWRFLICFCIGWIITNGWSYILLGIGILTSITWMKAVASAYLAFLWLPISPEKVVTVAIALFLARCLFPKHNDILRKQIMEAAESEPDNQASTPSAHKAAAPTSTEQSCKKLKSSRFELFPFKSRKNYEKRRKKCKKNEKTDKIDLDKN